jgi:hypothetical protein
MATPASYYQILFYKISLSDQLRGQDSMQMADAGAIGRAGVHTARRHRLVT